MRCSRSKPRTKRNDVEADAEGVLAASWLCSESVEGLQAVINAATPSDQATGPIRAKLRAVTPASLAPFDAIGAHARASASSVV
jgi:hypothetical protein